MVRIFPAIFAKQSNKITFELRIMNKIVAKEHFSEKVFKLEIEAPLIAKARKAGHFVIVRVGEKGERMPLTIAGG